MRSRTATWENIAASGDFSMNVKVSVGGTEYTSLTSVPVIKSNLAPEPLSVGNCFAAEMEFSLRTNDTIVKGAEVVLYIQITTATATSEWKSVGTFYISKRQQKNGIYDFKCYDKMMKANQPYVADPTASNARIGWPKSMQTVVNYICTAIGVTLDSRTVINTGNAYMVPYPGKKTMWEILGYIAGCHGGNFIITPDDTLRLVRSTFNTSGNTMLTGSNQVNIPVIIGNNSIGEQATVSRVTMTVDSDTGYTHGNDTGAELKILENPYASQQACDDIYNQVAGTTYVPFGVTLACFDPMAELGDWALINNEVQGVIYTMSCTYGRSFRADVSAPSVYEAEDEYPYKSALERMAENIGKQFEEVTDEYNTKLIQTRRSIEMEASAAVSKYDTSGLSYSIDLTGYGDPEAAGYDASQYEDNEVHYLDQSSGVVWTTAFGFWVVATAEPLPLITESLEAKIEETAESITLTVTNGERSSTIRLTGDGITTQSHTIRFTGNVVFASNLTDGVTQISGNNITTGKIKSRYIDLYGEMTVYTDSTVSASGGSIGYMEGYTRDTSGGAIYATRGIALKNGSNHLIVTTNGVRATVMDTSGVLHSAYIANKSFTITDGLTVRIRGDATVGGDISVTGAAYLSGGTYLANDTWIYGARTDGAYNSMLGMNSSNQIGVGSTGNKLKLHSNSYVDIDYGIYIKKNASGDNVALLGTTSSNTGALWLYDASGNTRAYLGSNGLALYDSAGNSALLTYAKLASL